MKPLILISNDDGITSRGIRLLVEVASQIGEVVVVAPDSPQSAMGHAITIADTLRLRKSDIFQNVLAYECSGTPADCIKIAKHHVLNGRKPDLVLSGMNHGSNSSISVLYSGTMSAAIEAAIEGLPAIGFSLCEYAHEADLSHCAVWIEKIILEALAKPFQKGLALNVNFPAKKEESIKGVKICRQAAARWEEKFEERRDPLGRNYFWMSGFFINEDKGEDTDEWALANNFVSIVPCQYDLTAHHAISSLNKDWSL